VGAEKGHDPHPHAVKFARQPTAPATATGKSTHKPVGADNTPGRAVAQLALTVGSTSRNGTIPMNVLPDRAFLPVGTPADTIDPPLPMDNGVPSSQPRDVDGASAEKTTPSPTTKTANSAPKPLGAYWQATVGNKSVFNSLGTKEGVTSPLPPTPMPDSDWEIGDGSGLKGEYYRGRKFDQFVFSRADPNINYDWVKMPDASPSPLIPAYSDYSIRWTGRIAAKYSETYKFYAAADDGVRVWINHKLIIDDWTRHPAEEFENTFDFKAGVQYLIKVEYLETGGGGASVQLYWQSPSQPKEYIPEDAFFYPLPSDEEAMKKDEIHS
jgi:hypothetical protein